MMRFDLNKISKRGIEIDQHVSFGPDYLKHTAIKKLNDCHVVGHIYYNITKEVIFDGDISGTMKLVDANTTELIDYPFNTHITEILDEDKQTEENLRTNMQNSLDLEEVLWQNIVLEVPSKVRGKKDEEITLEGDGWRLMTEDEYNKGNNLGLSELKTLLDKRKE